MAKLPAAEPVGALADPVVAGEAAGEFCFSIRLNDNTGKALCELEPVPGACPALSRQRPSSPIFILQEKTVMRCNCIQFMPNASATVVLLWFRSQARSWVSYPLTGVNGNDHRFSGRSSQFSSSSLMSTQR